MVPITALMMKQTQMMRFPLHCFYFSDCMLLLISENNKIRKEISNNSCVPIHNGCYNAIYVLFIASEFPFVYASTLKPTDITVVEKQDTKMIIVAYKYNRFIHHCHLKSSLTSLNTISLYLPILKHYSRSLYES